MNFHLGKPILVLLAVSVITGVATSFHKPPPKADLTLWVFAESHHRTYQPLVEKFAKQHHVTINLNLAKYDSIGAQSNSQQVRLTQIVDLPNVK